MAKLTTFTFQSHTPVTIGDSTKWEISRDWEGVEIPPVILPYLAWNDGNPWQEANLWIVSRAIEGEISEKTLRRDAWSLIRYANFLEERGMTWDQFRCKDVQKPTYLFKGYLIKKIKDSTTESSTAKTTLGAVTSFYIWALSNKLLQPGAKPFEVSEIEVEVSTRFGKKTIRRTSTDLSVKKWNGPRRSSLEGGLKPTPPLVEKEIVRLAETHCGEEMSLMLLIGFSTGIRLGTIAQLKTSTILESRAHAMIGHRALMIGPAYDVPTKFSKNYPAIVPEALLLTLQGYLTSSRRIKRVLMYGEQYANFLFLTPQGLPYVDSIGAPKSAFNVATSRIRKAARNAGIELGGFRFHDTRATFACRLMDSAHAAGISISTTLSLLTELLGQEDERTAQRYVDYAQKRRTLVFHNERYANWLLRSKNDDPPPYCH